MATRKSINPAGVWHPPSGLPRAVAVQAQRLLFLSGTTGRDENGNLAGSDIESQTHQIFKNISRTLAGAGATLDDLVRMTCYLSDMADYQQFHAIRCQYLPNLPASTSVCVKGFASQGPRLEIDGVAILKDD